MSRVGTRALLTVRGSMATMVLRLALVLVVQVLLACDDDRPVVSGGGAGGANAPRDAGGGGIQGADAGHSAGGAQAGTGLAGTGGMAHVDSGAGEGGRGGLDGGPASGAASSDGGAIDGAVPDHEPAFAVLRTLQCALYRACCDDIGLSTAGLDDCELELAERADWLAMEIASQAIRIDGDALSACVSAASARFMSCRDLPRGWYHDDVLPPIAACQAVLVGAVPEGEPCIGHASCEQGATPSYCTPTNGRTCLALPRGSLGDSCLMTSGPEFRSYVNKVHSEGDVDCRREDGLQCTGSAGVFECTAVKSTGDACVTEKECAADAYCDGTCQPRKAIGEPCTTAVQCSGHGCSSATHTCSDHYEPAAIFCEMLGI